MAKAWLLATACLVTGIAVGALTCSAAQRHIRASPDSDQDHKQVNEKMQLPDNNSALVSDKVIPDDITKPVHGIDRWKTFDEAVFDLERRITALEALVTESSPARPNDVGNNPSASAATGMNQQTLLAAGVDPGLASDFLRRQSQFEMQRLELRDQASREGWINSERFGEELREIEVNAGVLREEIGDDAYDRFLYLTGQPNRVVIESVIDGSPAQFSGIEAGDVILEYADKRIFLYPELLNATRAGERGEYIVMRLQRAGQLLELTLPRGPLGVRLDTEQINPDTASQAFIQN